MIEFLIGLGLFLIGIKLFKSNTQFRLDSNARIRETHRQNEKDAILAKKVAEMDTFYKKCLQDIGNLKASTELANKTTLDAIDRETRAKTALVAVLQAHHCSQQDIDEILSSIDNIQPGDLHNQ